MNWLSFSTKCLGHLCNDLTEIINDTEANKNAQAKDYFELRLRDFPNLASAVDKPCLRSYQCELASTNLSSNRNPGN